MVEPAQGLADQTQLAAASCQGQWLGGEAGLSTGMGGAPASATWMDGQQINRVGGATGPSQGMASQGQWMGGGAGPTSGMAGQTYSAATGGAVQRQNNKELCRDWGLPACCSRGHKKYLTVKPNSGGP